ncbi:MAG TPA: type II toxin-antitoxin system VapC family toxin [Syntrophothermus lipocalidus]|nr:type II toxin-antitoxin system VapC family toxin [Syntrophothermus lipocalidus]
MILYLDTSALVKLYAREAGSERVRTFVDSASLVATSKAAYAEARVAFARAFREGVLGEGGYLQMIEMIASLQSGWPRYLTLAVSDSLVWLAGELAKRYRLRRFDSIHLASAMTLKGMAKSPVRAVCFDARLWDAFLSSGFEVDPEVRPG